MKIELKAIKHYPRLSEETEAYNADVYIDGVKAFAVSNTGHGGSDEQTPYPPHKWDDIKRWDAAVAKTYPPMDMSAYQMDPIPASLETVCHDLLAEHLARNDLTRYLKSLVLLIVGEEVRALSLKGVRSLTPEQIDKLRAQAQRDYPGAPILNDLPFDEALAAFRNTASKQ